MAPASAATARLRCGLGVATLVLYLTLVVGIDALATLAGLVPSASTFAGLALAAVALAALIGLLIDRAASPIVALATAALAITLFFVPLAPRKAFTRAVQRIAVGDSREHVHEVMHAWRPGHPYGSDSLAAAEARPADEFYHHGQGGTLLSCDHCLVRFDRDRVTAVEITFD